MKILVSCVPFDNGRSGISVYMRETVRELQNAGHELTLVVEDGCREFFPECDSFIVAPRCCRRAVVSMLWHLFILPWMFAPKAYDFCLIAAANRRTFAFYRLFTVAVVHDLAQYHVKCKYDMLRMFYLKHVLPFFICRSPAVMAISRSTAVDLEKFWHVPAAKITVNYNGLTIANERSDEFLRKNGLTENSYIFYVSRIEHPGKNHLNLIKAYEMLSPELQNRYRLVLAGAPWHGAEEVYAYVDKSVVRDHIIFTGFTNMSELPQGYEAAAVYIFPSFFEGFGLSLIEAMHRGTPCCCSRNSSLGEIGEGAALLFDPESPTEIAAALSNILLDRDGIRAKLIAAGHEKCRLFSWHDHAAKIVEIYKNAGK